MHENIEEKKHTDEGDDETLCTELSILPSALQKHSAE